MSSLSMKMKIALVLIGLLAIVSFSHAAVRGRRDTDSDKTVQDFNDILTKLVGSLPSQDELTKKSTELSKNLQDMFKNVNTNELLENFKTKVNEFSKTIQEKTAA